MSAGRNDPSEEAARRGWLRRKWHSSCVLRGCVWSFVLLALPWAVLWGWLDWSGQRAIARELAWLRSHGLYVSLDEIPDQHVPDAQNAYLVYEEALGRDAFTRNTYQLERLDPMGQWRELFSAFLNAHSSLAPPPGSPQGPPPDPAALLAQVRAIMSEPGVVELLDALERGSLMPACVLPGPASQRVGDREAYGVLAACRNLLRVRAKLSTMDDRPDDALRWLTVPLRISNQLALDPSGSMLNASADMREFSLRGVQETLSVGTPSAGALRQFADALAAADPQADFDRFARAQTAGMVADFDQIIADPEGCLSITADPHSDLLMLDMALLRARATRLGRPLHTTSEARWLRWARKAYAASLAVPNTCPSQPVPTREPLYNRCLPAISPNTRYVALPPSLFYEYNLKARDATMVRVRVARVGVAVALYRAEHGAYPQSLSDLEAATGEALPLDPYTGAPMRYARRPDGFIVYSVGEDGQDHGGVAYDPYRRRSVPGVDVVWECPLATRPYADRSFWEQAPIVGSHMSMGGLSQ